MNLDPEVRAYLAERKLSQSFLARMDACPQSAYLYAKTRAIRVQSPAMARGEAFHDFAERAMRELLESGETTMAPDVGRELMESIVDERHDLAIPHYERDALRAMAWNWSAATEAHPIIPWEVKGLEVMPELQIGNWIVRGRIDRVEVVRGDVFIRDYKTSLSIPSQEKFDKSFQLPLYALCWAEGTVDGERVGEKQDTFNVAEDYPRFLSKQCRDCDTFNDAHDHDECRECGGVDFRPPTTFKRRGLLGKRELHDFKRHVKGILNKLDTALETDEWPAAPGSHCATCSAPALCPLPRSLRPASITTTAEAVALARDVDRHEQELKRDKKALKEWAGHNGEISFDNKVMDFKTVHIRRADEQIVSTRFVTRDVAASSQPEGE